MSIKKENALAMYYIGESRTFIRNSLRVKVKKLNKWIRNDKRTEKEQIIHLFFFGYPKKKICKTYNLSNNTFDLWLFEAFDDIESHLEKEKPRLTQPGRTQWTTEIIKQTLNN
jgi:uncharacterized protein YjcR